MYERLIGEGEKLQRMLELAGFGEVRAEQRDPTAIDTDCRRIADFVHQAVQEQRSVWERYVNWSMDLFFATQTIAEHQGLQKLIQETYKEIRHTCRRVARNARKAGKDYPALREQLDNVAGVAGALQKAPLISREEWFGADGDCALAKLEQQYSPLWSCPPGDILARVAVHRLKALKEYLKKAALVKGPSGKHTLLNDFDWADLNDRVTQIEERTVRDRDVLRRDAYVGLARVYLVYRVDVDEDLLHGIEPRELSEIRDRHRYDDELRHRQFRAPTACMMLENYLHTVLCGLRETKTEHSADFTSVLWYNTGYEFTKTQAACVQELWVEWEKGGLGLSEKTLAEKIGSDSNRFRLRDTFRRKKKSRKGYDMHPAWGTMIEGTGEGVFRLSPPKS